MGQNTILLYRRRDDSIFGFQRSYNIFSNQIIKNKDDLYEYKITDKGTLQISDNQDIPSEILRKIFVDSVR